MTALTSLEVESYFERVYAALADLSDEVRDELLEELPDHLAEVAAEEDGRLIERLGEPEAYAAELRAAAGIEAIAVSSGSRITLVAGRAAELGRQLNLRGARFMGYGRVTDLLRALRPGWWVLRGWLVAQLVSGTHDRASWHGFLPSVGGNAVVGLVLLLAAVAASIWIGTRSLGWGVWSRRITGVAGIALALWGIGVLARNVGGTVYSYSYSDSGYQDPLQSVQDVYVYDQNGTPVPNARLYDQNGNPVQLGQGYCTNGEAAPYVNSQSAWTYPLCPADPGPFQAGPGAASGVPSSGVPSSGVPSSGVPSSPKPSSSPTVSTRHR